MYRNTILLAGGLLLLSAATVRAQDAVLGQLYGSGVHAYFSSDFIKAHEQFTAAMDGKTRDPRCFYFRGLTYLELNREEEATMDFQQGAELEAADINQFYNVSKALERVQGRSRLTIERYRVRARMAAFERAERLRKARYEALRSEEARVLQEQAEAAPEKPIEKPAEPLAKPSTPRDPFATGPIKEPPKPTETKPVEPKTQPALPTTDPFAEKPAEKPAEKRSGHMFDALRKAVTKAAGGGAKKKVAELMKKPVPEAELDPDEATPLPAKPLPAKPLPAIPAPEAKPAPETKPSDDVDDPFARFR